MSAELQWRVEQLLARYAEVLDDGPLEAWPELFTEQCLYQIIPRDNFDAGLPLAIMRCESRGMLMDRVRSVQETIVFEPRYLRHHITNVRIRQALGARLQAVSHYSVIEVLPDSLPQILSVGRYLDVLEEHDGELRFLEKRVVYDSVLVPNSIIYPL